MERRSATAERADGPGPDPAAAARSIPRAAPAGVGGLWRLTWWSSVGLAYGLGVFVVVAVFVTEPFGPVAVVAAVGAACASVASARLFGRALVGLDAGDEPGSIPVHLVVIGVSGALATVVAAQWAAGGPATWSIIPGLVTAAIAVSVPRRLRVAILVGGGLVATAVAVSAGYLVAGRVDLTSTAGEAALVVMIGSALVFGLWTWDVVARLDRARRVEGELAVADERLRFAADLHDVQGHRLQVIALKSELAARLVEADPPAAGAHMREVHEHARAALDDTRAVVQGYRRASLGSELVNATRVLAAAGIDGRLVGGAHGVADDVPEPGRHLLGLVVREGTTNVLRHSRAGVARLALEVGEGSARLEMRNDGAAAATDDTVAAAPGTGLVALAERLQAAGGALHWGRQKDWFTVAARIPVTEEGAA